jgi:hypothetical protein
LKEGPEERRKKMSGRKEALWAVAISAALVTAGLILSCGDDDNGAVSCQDVCEKLAECEDFFDEGEIAGTVAECVDSCEEELAGAGEEFLEAFRCIPDTDCWEIKGSCFCPTVCERLNECYPINMAHCMYGFCEDYLNLGEIMCFFEFSSCLYIDMFCPSPY